MADGEREGQALDGLVWPIGVGPGSRTGGGYRDGCDPARGGTQPGGAKRALPAWLIAVLTVASLLALVGVSADVIQHEFGKWGTWGTWHVPR